MKKQNQGFTLIELLVVIAIIAILSTVVMAGLNSARQKGRDAKRLSDIKSVQAALELFFDTCNGYPESSGTAGAIGDIVTHGYTMKAGNALVSSCATQFSTYMVVLPTNPTPAATTGPTDYLYCGTYTAGKALLHICDTPNGIPMPEYVIEFVLEGQTGALGPGPHYATASGIL